MQEKYQMQGYYQVSQTSAFSGSASVFEDFSRLQYQ